MPRTIPKGDKKEKKVTLRSDGELYKRPEPNPFSENWLDGFKAGYDGTSHYHNPRKDLEWRDGYRTGQDQMIFDAEEMNREHSSNV